MQRLGPRMSARPSSKCSAATGRAADRKWQNKAQTTIRITVRDNEPGVLGEDSIRDDRPTPEEALREREEGPCLQGWDTIRGAALLKDPTLPRDLRALVQLLQQRPQQSISTLARRLGRTTKTVKAHLRRLAEFLQ